MLRLVFKLSLRQTEDFLRSVLFLMGVDLERVGLLQGKGWITERRISRHGERRTGLSTTSD